MQKIRHSIDPYIFEKQFKAFKKFVEEQSAVSFVSFSSNPYTYKQEGYKYEIYRDAREKLAFQAWKKSDIGSGDIIESTIEAIEISNNNLVQWQSRYGEANRPHQPLYVAKHSLEEAKKIEECIFNLYHGFDIEKSFNDLMSFFGKKYALIAYLFFLKDSTRYLPIAPKYFDRAFELLGVDFTTSHRCSWENYSEYLNLIRELKQMLSEIMSSDISMLDAHSFAWMLSSHMEKEGKLADITEYLSLNDTERESIVKSRIGQGQYRKSLIDYWSKCAVTGCQKFELLIASHIKPWKESDISERLDLYNGLLLSPTLDACFDSGFISFDDYGNILISEELTEQDISTLGLHKSMKLFKIESKHKKYLAYHRANILKKVNKSLERNI